MATEREIRSAVEAFARREGSAFDATRLFAAWVLHTQHQLNVLDALAQTASSGGDDPLTKNDLADGYAIVPGNAFRPPQLLVLRAVFSSNETDVLQGLADLARSLNLAGSIAYHGHRLDNEGPRLRRLRETLDAMPPSERARLHLRGELAHLLDHDADTWLQQPKVRKACNDFSVALAQTALTPDFTTLGPRDMRVTHSLPLVLPAAAREIGFSGTHWGTPEESVWLGRGRLADLVGLYDHYREALFAKNVRTYLHQEAAKASSAARHIRKALEAICAGAPNLYFTMAHNGITLTAPSVKKIADDTVRVEPLGLGMHVLNGCQTLYTAWDFWRDREAQEARSGDRRWREAWQHIWIPLRIVVTTDEERVREVTVATNRQTEIRTSAFWAHDAIQVALDRRFGRQGIFYERQQEAWENLQRSGSPRTAEYPNGVINLEALARVVAAAAPDVAIEHARSPMGIFDSEQVYRKVFAPDKLRSTTLLVGLFNLQQATRLALRDLSESFAPLSDLPLRSFQFPVFRLTAMWLAEHDPAWLLAQGDRVYRNAARNQLREATVKLLGPHYTEIQSVLRDIWGASDGWHDAYNARLLKQAVKTLGLSQSPFAIDTPSDP
jgi:hypothetical protein